MVTLLLVTLGGQPGERVTTVGRRSLRADPVELVQGADHRRVRGLLAAQDGGELLTVDHDRWFGPEYQLVAAGPPGWRGESG